jgi:hypothetical protein
MEIARGHAFFDVYKGKIIIDGEEVCDSLLLGASSD